MARPFALESPHDGGACTSAPLGGWSSMQMEASFFCEDSPGRAHPTRGEAAVNARTDSATPTTVKPPSKRRVKRNERAAEHERAEQAAAASTSTGAHPDGVSPSDMSNGDAPTLRQLALRQPPPQHHHLMRQMTIPRASSRAIHTMTTLRDGESGRPPGSRRRRRSSAPAARKCSARRLSSPT